MPFETFPSYPPVDAELVDRIVSKLKSQGIFDQFRKDCLADVDTKPAYQNLQQRVNGTVATFLATQTWQQDLNKTQLRESLRRHVQQGFLEVGVDRIVDQVVNPKIIPVFMPKVEDVVYDCLGIEKPQNQPPPNLSASFITIVPSLPKTNNPDKSTVVDLLPKDLDPVSPESDNVSAGTPTKDERNNNESSPKYDKEDSELSGISDLSSHMGDSFKENQADSNTVKSISSPKGTPSDLQFDNFTNLSEKIRQAEISHGQVTYSHIDVKLEDEPDSSTNEVLPVENIELPLKEEEKEIKQEIVKLETISNNSLSMFDDSKNFTPIKIPREDTCTSFSEDSMASSGFSNKDKIINNIPKVPLDSENSINPGEQDEKSSTPKENTIEKELNEESQTGEDPVAKTDSTITDENKDSKKYEKRDHDSSTSSKMSKSSDKHKTSSSRPRSSREKDKKDESKSSKDKGSSQRDEKDRTSKDERDRSRHKDDKNHSSKEKHREKDRNHDRTKENDKKLNKQDSKENSEKDKKNDKEHNDKDKSSKDKCDKDKDKDRSGRSRHDKDRSEKEKRERDKSDKEKEKKEKTDREKFEKDKVKTEKEEQAKEKPEKEKIRHERSKHEKDKESKNEKDKDSKHEKSKDSKHEKDKETKRSRDEKKDIKKKESKKDEKSSHSSSSKKGDNQKYEDSDKKNRSGESSNRSKQNGEKSKIEDEKKDRKRKGERCNDEIRSKEARRSSDRDSSGGKGGSSHRNSNSENRSGSSRESGGHSEKKIKNSNAEGTTDCLEPEDQPSDEIDGPSEVEKIITQLNSSIEESQNAKIQSDDAEKEPLIDEIPVKKPKIANNIFEIRKIMQARKNIDRKFRHELMKNRKEDEKDVAPKTLEKEEPSSPEQIKDSNIPEENKENIKTQKIEKMRVSSKNPNSKAKFYGFQQCEIDKSYNNFITCCKHFNYSINKNEDLSNFKLITSAEDNEELLDDNLNNLKPKVKSLDNSDTAENLVKTIENGKKCYVHLSRSECSFINLSKNKSGTNKKFKAASQQTVEKTDKTEDFSQHGEVEENPIAQKGDECDQGIAEEAKAAISSASEPTPTQPEQPSSESPLKKYYALKLNDSTEEKVTTAMTEDMLDSIMMQSVFLDQDNYGDPDDSDYEESLRDTEIITEIKKEPIDFDELENELVTGSEKEGLYDELRNLNENVESNLAEVQRQENSGDGRTCNKTETEKDLGTNLVPLKKEPGTPKEGAGEKVTRRNQRLSRSSQRYESTDLYKPRPVLPQNSKRVRSSRSVLSEDTQKTKNDLCDLPVKRRGR